MKSHMFRSIGLLGLLVLVTGAHAQTTFDVTNPNPVMGQWVADVVESGDSFRVTVSSNYPNPIADGDQVMVTILNDSNDPIHAHNDGGGIIGFGAGAWNNVADGDTIDWQWSSSLFPVQALDSGSTNFFDGAFDIVPLPGEKPVYVDVTVTNSSGYGPWSTEAQLTPEASSLSLLIPGLVPLCIALRKRCKNRS